MRIAGNGEVDNEGGGGEGATVICTGGGGEGVAIDLNAGIE